MTMKIKAIFNAEIYEVFDLHDNLIDSSTSYEELLALCKEKGYELVSIEGLDNED